MQLTIQDIPLDAVLCYVKDNIAYFTTQELHKQWGDDWFDSSYEDNAGPPYEPNEEEAAEWSITRLCFKAELESPAQKARRSSNYSVHNINHGAVAWLASPSYADHRIYIQAGTTIRDFITKIHTAGGTVYVPLEQEKQNV